MYPNSWVYCPEVLSCQGTFLLILTLASFGYFRSYLVGLVGEKGGEGEPPKPLSLELKQHDAMSGLFLNSASMDIFHERDGTTSRSAARERSGARCYHLSLPPRQHRALTPRNNLVLPAFVRTCVHRHVLQELLLQALR